MTTGGTGSVSSGGATLQGSYLGATGTVTRTGFKYGTTSGSLDNDAYTNGASASFSETVSGLLVGTTYYYQAYIVEGGETVYGTERSFTTSAYPNYLGCYEVPAVAGILNGNKQNGTNASRGDTWTRYNTNNNKRQIATHAFAQDVTVDPNTDIVRNYTVLFDQDKYAPLWVAYAMHSTKWKKILSGRSGSWGTDPAIGLTQQSGLDNAQDVGYSRGHMVSSGERQTTANQNEQTFYYSNQAPQWQNSFNSGIWSSLEGDIIDNAPSGRDTLYIVTGVLYEGTVSNGVVTSATVPTLPSGSYNVPIPSHFYKCLMKCRFNAQGEMTAASGCAYIFTNEAHVNGTYSSGITSIDAIEARSGFDFFANVPSGLQATAEAQSAALW